ncbi:MAG TPA: hypothetical protein DEA99_07820 [Candidatus Omnitrophica bacterium]|nr:hypothetical protein [Candidatus Omnitrophota bacterium]
MLSNLGRLQQELSKFAEDFRLLGNHIRGSSQKYDDADKRLSKFQDKLISSSAAKSETIGIE